MCRVQRYESVAASGQRTHVQLWDCSGSAAAREHSRALSEVCLAPTSMLDLQCMAGLTQYSLQGADGVVLVCNPGKLAQEQELEHMYKEFVQPMDLTKQQCMVLSLNLTAGRSIGGAVSGRLAALQQKQVDIDPEDPSTSQPQLAQAVDELVVQCVARQKELAEDDVIEGTDM